MNAQRRQELIEYLGRFVSENKKSLIGEVLKWRTRFITIVLEDIYQSQNASAAIRTCECMGIQDLYVIENRNPYTLNPDVTLGSSKWTDLYRFKKDQNNTASCYSALREKGYRIVATVPDRDSKPLHRLSLDSPVALSFGNEEKGLSETAISEADECIYLPMFGFTRSFNISVSVAIALSQLIPEIHSTDHDWQLSDEERDELRLKWYQKVAPRGKILSENWEGKLNRER